MCVDFIFHSEQIPDKTTFMIARIILEISLKGFKKKILQRKFSLMTWDSTHGTPRSLCSGLARNWRGGGRLQWAACAQVKSAELAEVGERWDEGELQRQKSEADCGLCSSHDAGREESTDAFLSPECPLLMLSSGLPGKCNYISTVWSWASFKERTHGGWMKSLQIQFMLSSISL